MRSINRLLVIVLCLLCGVANAHAYNVTDFIPEEFKLFWPAPVRAHPGVPLDFRFIAYEKSNRLLHWQLLNAPAGMTINQDGHVDWIPNTAQIGRYDITVQVSRDDGVMRQHQFSLDVNTADFYFVSPDGNDSNPGTLALPFRTIDRGMRSVEADHGKTIYIRAGTYLEHYNWEVDGVISPFRGKHFSEADPVIIRGYPGEIPVLDCELQGHGLWAFETSFIIFANLEVRNARAVERGGIVFSSSDNIVAQDTVVRNSNWPASYNATGYLVNSTNSVLDHTEGSGNRDPQSESWNSSNYLFYNTGAETTNYVLGSRSTGSIVGFKIKHAGPRKLVVHNCTSFDEQYGFALGDDYSSVRFSTALRNVTGVLIGMADPNPYTRSNILIEHNTIINSSSVGLEIQDGYMTESPPIVHFNLIYNNRAPGGPAEGDNRLMVFWPFESAGSARSLDVVGNLLFSPSEQYLVRIGNGAERDLSLAQWRQKEPGVHFGDPGFVNFGGDNFALTDGSAAEYSDGTFAGSYTPHGIASGPPPGGETPLDPPPSTGHSSVPAAPRGFTAVLASP